MSTPTGHSAHGNASYVTAACKVSRFSIPSQHACERERDRDPDNYLAHVNLPICRAEAMSVLKVILIDVAVFALAALGVSLGLARFATSRLAEW